LRQTFFVINDFISFMSIHEEGLSLNSFEFDLYRLYVDTIFCTVVIIPLVTELHHRQTSFFLVGVSRGLAFPFYLQQVAFFNAHRFTPNANYRDVSRSRERLYAWWNHSRLFPRLPLGEHELIVSW